MSLLYNKKKKKAAANLADGGMDGMGNPIKTGIATDGVDRIEQPSGTTPKNSTTVAYGVTVTPYLKK